MKTKLLFHEYDKSSGTTALIEQNKYGKFFSVAVVDEHDEDIASEWQGATLCEYKNDIQAYNIKAKIMNQRAIGIENAVKTVKNSRDDWTEEELAIIERFARQARLAKRDAALTKRAAHNMRKHYIDYAEQYAQKKREFIQRRNEENQQ